MSESFELPLSRQLREIAMAYPETTEGASCVNRAFKAGGKRNFLFVGEKDGRVRLMFKLDASIEEARTAAQTGPGELSVGKGGWVTAFFSPDAPPDVDLLTAWIDESFRLFAPKKLLAQLDA